MRRKSWEKVVTVVLTASSKKTVWDLMSFMCKQNVGMKGAPFLALKSRSLSAHFTDTTLTKVFLLPLEDLLNLLKIMYKG